MKTNSKIKILIIAVIAVLVIITGFALASSGSENKSGKIVTRSESSIFFEEVNNDPTKVDVYLGMHDTASIASFQVGLEIDMADCYDAEFKWEDNLNMEKNTDVKYSKAVTSEQEKDEVTGNIAENLNLYYVGTKELNNLTENTDVDNIKLGTISIVPAKDKEGEDVPVRSSFVTMQTRGNFSKTVSLSHASEPIITNLDNQYESRITVKEAPTIDNLTAQQEADVNGKKVVVDFDVNNSTNSLTALEVRLVDGEGNVKYVKQININDLANEIPVTFLGVDEGTYTVKVVGSYALDGGVTKTNELLKTSAGDDAEVTNVTVLATDETDRPGGDSGGEQGDDSDKPGGSGDSGNPGGSSGSGGTGNPSNPSGSNDGSDESEEPGSSDNSDESDGTDEATGSDEESTGSDEEESSVDEEEVYDNTNPKTSDNVMISVAVGVVGIATVVGVTIYKRKGKNNKTK